MLVLVNVAIGAMSGIVIGVPSFLQLDNMSQFVSTLALV